MSCKLIQWVTFAVAQSVFLFPCHAQTAQGMVDECIGARIQVEVAKFAIVEDFSKTVEELTAMSEGEVEGRLETGHVVAKIVAKIIPTKSMQECHSAVLTVGYSNVVLRVASDLAQNKDGCPFQEAYRHELGHARLYQKVLDEIKPLIETDLSRHFEKGYDGSQKSMADALMWAAKRLRRVNELNSSHDSKEEYDRLDRSCLGQAVRSMSK